MTGKSVLMAAVSGGITAAVVIAMASGVSPTGAKAHDGHGDHAASHDDGHGEHGASHDAGHESAGGSGHDDGHGGGHGAEPMGGHGDEHASGGHEDDHGPGAGAATKVASHGSSKGDDGHGDPHGKPQAGHSDPHGQPAKSSGSSPAGSASHGEAGSVAADEALKLLMDGNTRWVAGKPTSPNTDAARRKDVTDNGQKPFVTVLTCADSRLPVERIVDRGVGEVFVVRVAGNIAGTSEIGTVEYGLGHLNTPLLVVMGHSKCGAVGAAVAGADVHGKIADIVDAIEPAVARAKRKNPDAKGDDLTKAAIKENVWQTVFSLIRESKDIRSLVAKGKVKVVGAVCDISTGEIEWLGEHPWQAEMIDALTTANEAKAAAAPAAGH
jgi:carbonic anhydrase